MRVAPFPVPSFQAAVNHLLRRESWALAQLLPYAGRRARLHVSAFSFDVLVAQDGLLALPATLRDAAPVARAWRAAATFVPTMPGGVGAVMTAAAAQAGSATGLAAASGNSGGAAAGDVADVEITVLPDAMPALLRYGPSVLMKHVRIEGDAEFAQALGRLAEHLRWEPEEDLAQWIGDAAAFRMIRGVRQVGAQLRQLADGALGQVAEYLLDERPQLVRTRVNEAFAADVAATAQRIQALEARIARLQQQRTGGAGRMSPSPSSTKHTGAPR
ncbi:ubiquinone biosynthesis accessory factor UbiJ [Robbsia andropogonis]|uniref:ubiquinone biosynthesis accessory factor UbiJ n=1 Tax=Robbsia andropogonis TaxID=28092 RepID=UPI00209D0E0C|nr:sterol-binding protein [Robbsia andropogonis]MCP1117078.1 sterol-binding protein [Robbsia andropogonis]MCP1128425.1 sterol-binding protein [Robbsia andropogonis]